MTRACLRLSRLACVAALLSLAAPPAARAQPAPAAARFDAVLTKGFTADQPGAAVIVVKDGAVVYRKAVGMAHMELGVPLQPDSVFRLGSITKQFTAAAVMLLVEDGKVALSDPVEKYLPGYPTQGHVITVEHLLTHTSGIKSYTSIPGYFPKRIRADLSLTELIDGFKQEPMQFAPGQRYEYNNSAYVMLGAVIEKASGQRYEDFLQARIFGPLGMTRTTFGSNEPLIKGRVQGYTRDKDVVRNADFLSMTQPHAAGSLVSSVDDLAKWDAALTAGKVLKPASLEKMATPYTLKDGTSTGYGYGLQVDTLRGRATLEHAGGIPGFSTYAIRVPKDRVYVAVLANSDRPTASPETMARRMAALALGDPFPERTAITVAPEVLARYAGVYEAKQGRRTVIAEGGKLYTLRGGERVEARPFSPTEFFFDDDLTTLKFEVGADGRATTLLRYVSGSDTPERAERTADAPSAPPAAAGGNVRVDPAIYDTYVGDYELAPNFILTVSRSGDRLMTQATGQQQIEIFPLSETEFAPKVVEARITFVKGPDGKVTQLVLKQNGRDMVARRK
ncbi:serine hydrolase [Luteitalea sp. TBR-22]|uniref:serine hydrolase n=1 Tax=Luteitalea sp. TBR-22 TaxID=2802971 RepID=UPI001AF4FE0E|nr:serine hydrolase [Luteitalea sp. TBR-22]